MAAEPQCSGVSIWPVDERQGKCQANDHMMLSRGYFVGLDTFRVTHGSSPGAFEIITSLATLVALGFAIYQSILARRALNAAREAIEDDRRARQLSLLPEMSWVVQVQTRLDKWLSDLEEMKSKTLEALENKNEEMLKAVVRSAVHEPKKVPYGVDRWTYEKVPAPLRRIMMSGAQYYYDASAPAAYLWTEGSEVNWYLVAGIDERFDDSIFAIKKLQGLLTDMTPRVILETPASLKDGDFLSG